MSKRFALFLAWDTPILAAMDAAPYWVLPMSQHVLR